MLPQQFGSRQEIDWASLLPSPNETRWMTFDEIAVHPIPHSTPPITDFRRTRPRRRSSSSR